MRLQHPIVLVVFVLSACGGGGGGPGDDADGGDDAADTGAEVPTDVPADSGGDTAPDAEADSGCVTDGDCDDADPCTDDVCTDYGACDHEIVDADGDGYPALSVDGHDCGGTDCDDGNDAVHPDADLDCVGDGDFDCDGRPDRDEDEDGYLSPDCGGDDCDDDDPLAFPGSLDVDCSDADHDCNGHEDRDNDGDGDDREECGGGDCDDGDPLVSSLADEDDCDGLDTDCDGYLGRGEDDDGDGYAHPACVAPGHEPDCDDDDEDVYPGAPTQCDMVDDDCSGTWRDESGADDDGDTVLDEACGGEDCDDTDAATYAGAPEICANGNDEDCDGVADALTSVTSNVRLTNAVGESGYCAAAWSGSEYAVVWHDDRDGNPELYLARVAPDGSKVGSDVRLTDAVHESWEPDVAWTGSEYGVVWEDSRDANYEIYFMRVSASGVKQGSDVQVTDAIWYSLSPHVTWSGSQFGITWVDSRSGDNEIYFMRVSASGVKQGGDVRITNSSGVSTVPTIAWSGSEYGLTWYDDRGGDTEVYFARVSASGVKQTSDVQITAYMRASDAPDIVWTGSEWGIAWSESRDLNPEVYFVRLDGDGDEVGPETRLTFSAGDSVIPALGWTGSEYVVVWQDDRDGNLETYFASFSATGVKSGTDFRVTNAGSDSARPALAWTGSEVGVFWEDARDGNFEVYMDVMSYCE